MSRSFVPTAAALLSMTWLTAPAAMGSAAVPAASLAASPDVTPETNDEIRVEFRVLSAAASGGGGDFVRIDRGAAAGLEPGDRVVFTPLGRARLEGTVLRVEEREATVEVPLRVEDLAPGVPGEAVVPASRVETGSQRSEADQAASGRPPITWSAGDVTWEDDAPLLAEPRILARDERAPDWTGRTYLTSDVIRDRVGAGRDDQFLRLGFDLRGTNVFGRGGMLRIDGELNHRRTEVADGQGEEETLGRLDRLSYTLGGARDAPRRFEFGRFLPQEYPELGLLDGLEVSWRVPSGHRVGTSVGFLPSFDRDRSTGETLQVATWTSLALDAEERLQVGGALQKTWHKGQEDRELLLTRVRWTPAGPWTAFATAWWDFYGSEDSAKEDSVELTQLLASLTRRLGKDAGVSLSGSVIRYPQLLRGGLQGLPTEILTDGRSSRVTVAGWQRFSGKHRLHARVDQWADQSSGGGGGELGWDHQLGEGLLDRFDVSAFYREGRFGDVAGVRAGFGGPLAAGRWRAHLDLGQFDQTAFDGEQSELLQNALHLGWDGALAKDWYLSLTTSYRFGDEQDAISLGFLLQRSF